MKYNQIQNVTFLQVKQSLNTVYIIYTTYIKMYLPLCYISIYCKPRRAFGLKHNLCCQSYIKTSNVKSVVNISISYILHTLNLI